MRRPAGDDGRGRGVLALLCLMAVAVMTVDASGESESPVDAVRSATGEVVGPVQSGLDAVASPFEELGDRLGRDADLRADNERLEAENSDLRGRLETAGLDVARAGDTETVAGFAEQRGLRTVAAEVVAYGPAQSFSRTVTIDAGTSDGVHADMTVLNADGLVGRVLRADSGTATVLLVVDPGSVVGGRLGADLELGFLSGGGDLSDDARLTLTTMDPQAVPDVGDAVLTWGSQQGRPYVSGIPIGAVESVSASPRDSTVTARITPYVDFSSLDLVRVVVGASATTDLADGARTTADD